MIAQKLSPVSEVKVLELLRHHSRSTRRDACLKLEAFDFSPDLESKLCSVAENDDIADVRRAARKALLGFWGRSRGTGPKSEADQIRKHLATHGITTLYHVTAEANWQNIQASGRLLSRARLNEMGTSAVFIADCEYDRACGTSEWVHLCFHPNQPMFYRRIPAIDRGNFVVLDVDVKLALWDSAVFSNEYATMTRAKLGPRLADLQKLNLACFADSMFTADSKSSWQAEVLVYEAVPVSAITRTRSYAEVLKEHQTNVPMGAKLAFMNHQAGLPVVRQ